MTGKDLGYTVTTAKDIETATTAVTVAAEEKGFKVQHIHDVAETLISKGFPRTPYRIIEICNAKYADAALRADINVGLMMPCKINVYEAEGRTHVSAMRPALLATFFPDAGLETLANQVDAAVCAIVDAAV